MTDEVNINIIKGIVSSYRKRLDKLTAHHNDMEQSLHIIDRIMNMKKSPSRTCKISVGNMVLYVGKNEIDEFLDKILKIKTDEISALSDKLKPLEEKDDGDGT